MKKLFIIVAFIAAFTSGMILTQINAQDTVNHSIVVSNEQKTVTLDVPGMHCPTCPFTVRKSLEKIPGVLDVKTSSDTKTAIIKYNSSKVNIDELIAATTNVGYPSTLHQCKNKTQSC
tara:strand:+ start:393 stop:746 length:354 start_codon:yes stop_codon:yes gene_type:complete